MKDFLYIWHSTPLCHFVFLPLCSPVFVAKCILEIHQHFCFLCFLSHWHFQFYCVLVPSRPRNHTKSFHCHRNDILCTLLDFHEFYSGNKTSNPEQAVWLLIIWQAPREGSMRRILCSDWLPQRARWSDTARPGLPVSFPLIKFRQNSRRCTKLFFRRNYFLLS